MLRSPRPRILLVDADVAARDRLERRCTEAGWLVSAAGTWDQALALGRQQPHDLLLVEEAFGNGLASQLLRRLREVDPSIRGVMISRAPSVVSAVQAIRAGFEDYSPNPIEPRRLDELLRQPAPTAEPPPAAPTESARHPGGLPSLEQVEWQHINTVLVGFRGNITRAARALGVDRRSLQRRLRRQAPSN